MWDLLETCRGILSVCFDGTRQSKQEANAMKCCVSSQSDSRYTPRIGSTMHCKVRSQSLLGVDLQSNSRQDTISLSDHGANNVGHVD